MPEHDVDLFVIGGGSGGVRAARIAAGLGARVALAEEARMGGTCVNVGCVPKKLFTYASHFGEDFEDAAGFGWDVGERSFSWKRLLAAKDAEIARLNAIYERLLVNAGVAIHPHRAVVVGPNAVEVGGKRVTADHILVATGGKPWKPGIPGRDHCWTSDDLFALQDLPSSILVVGAGYIGCEFAGIFEGLGVQVTLVHRGDQILGGFDHDVREHLATEMRKRGVQLHMGAFPVRVDPVEGGMRVHLSDGSDHLVGGVLLATGRRPYTSELGLDLVGVDLGNNGSVKVDHHYRTNVPSIFAVGDVVDHVQLTPVALAEGMYVAHHLYGKKGRKPRYDLVPTAVFTNPNVGTVGLTEEAAREQVDDVVVYESRFKPMKHTLSGRDTATYMKLVVDGESDRVLGCHVVGPEAGELVQGIAVALTAGARKADFDATIGIHPTSAEELVTLRTPRAR
ncbi:MAG: glutathione-disulfide reductase [Myxococcales bacterium]|nr:glutathione-disulfide reductase [Myxococcales bacterium]